MEKIEAVLEYKNIDGKLYILGIDSDGDATVIIGDKKLTPFLGTEYDDISNKKQLGFEEAVKIFPSLTSKKYWISSRINFWNRTNIDTAEKIHMIS